jgi:hypothetical protein
MLKLLGVMLHVEIHDFHLKNNNNYAQVQNQTNHMGDVVLDPSTFAVSKKEMKAPTMLKLKKESYF